MAFYRQLNNLIFQCRKMQKSIDAKGLKGKEPYKTKHSGLTQVINLYEEKKSEIEGLCANNIKVTGIDDFSRAREQYYELLKVVPAYLNKEKKIYYYLQTYKVAVTNLLITFTYSTFRGDWPKKNALANWLITILNDQEAHDAEASLKKSFEDLRELGDFEKLDRKGLQQLQEEVRNIQTLLSADEKLEAGISAEDSELFSAAAEYLSDNASLLEGLPEIDSGINFEHPPALETVANRCTQLRILVEDFREEYVRGTKVSRLYEFKESIEGLFDKNIEICSDIHKAIIKEIGSHKKPGIKKLCKMILNAIEPFTDEVALTKAYKKASFPDSSEIQKGIPDAIDFEMSLMIGIDKI
jgi:hypothetical protein